MIRFEDNVSIEDIIKSVSAWVFKTDGYDGATGGITGNLIWTEEMQSYLPWDNVDKMIDEAIGPTYEINPVAMVSNNLYVEVVRAEIRSRAINIKKAYGMAIDMLNEKANAKNDNILLIGNTKRFFIGINPMMKSDYHQIFKIDYVIGNSVHAVNTKNGCACMFPYGLNKNDYLLID